MGQWHSLWSLIRNRFLAIRDRIVEIAVEKGNKNPIAHPTLNYVATVPDPPGASLAFVAEAIRRADPSTYRRVAQQVICGTGIVRIVSQEFVHSAHFHFIPAMTPLSLQG